MDRYAVSEMRCMSCGERQPVAAACRACAANMARYYCNICHLFDDEPGKDIYHCPFCNVCRCEGLALGFGAGVWGGGLGGELGGGLRLGAGGPGRGGVAYWGEAGSRTQTRKLSRLFRTHRALDGRPLSRPL